MRGLSLTQFNIITEFINTHHKFGKYKTESMVQDSVDAGVIGDLSKYHLNIKYINTSYDTRSKTIWKVELNNVIFATNTYNVLAQPPKNWIYEDLFPLIMDYLKGQFIPTENFLKKK
jgi:hypothetical protein